MAEFITESEACSRFLNAVSAYGPVQTYDGVHYRAHCPGHLSSHPSLSISAGEVGVVLNCHSGCRVDHILEALGWKFADLLNRAS